jgi:WD40 repeat protein
MWTQSQTHRQGQYILTGDNGRCITIYDAQTAQELKVLGGHRNLVRSVSVDPSADLIVSGGYDHEVRVWDLSTGEPIRRVRDWHASLVFGVAAARGQVISCVALSVRARDFADQCFRVSHDTTVQVLTFGAGLPYRGLFA